MFKSNRRHENGRKTFTTLSGSEVPCQGCITPTMRDVCIFCMTSNSAQKQKLTRRKKNQPLPSQVLLANWPVPSNYGLCNALQLHMAMPNRLCRICEHAMATANDFDLPVRPVRLEVLQQFPPDGIQLDDFHQRSQARSFWCMFVGFADHDFEKSRHGSHTTIHVRSMCLANLLMFRSVPLAYNLKSLESLCRQATESSIRWIIA